MKISDSSEIQEAALLFEELAKPASSGSIRIYEPAAAPAAATPVATPPPAAPQPMPQLKTSTDGKLYKSDQLENVLIRMCARGGFKGAVVADGRGLPVAVHNSPVDIDAISAFTTILGGSLEKAAFLLNEQNANNISIDVNYTDKAVLRLFKVDNAPYYLMVICLQETDERSEVEITIEEIARILKAA